MVLFSWLSDNAVYVGSASVGDRVLEVNTWYIEDSTSLLESATIVSVQKDECVPVRSSNRVFDPETGKLRSKVIDGPRSQEQLKF